jgi:hypothetical protein
MLIGVDIPPLIENLRSTVVDYQALHERLGHANDKKVAATAKKWGINILVNHIPVNIVLKQN